MITRRSFLSHVAGVVAGVLAWSSAKDKVNALQFGAKYPGELRYRIVNITHRAISKDVCIVEYEFEWFRE